MTTFTLAPGVTNEAEGDLVASIHEILRSADSAGVPLNAVLQTLVDRGYELPAITTTIMQLIRGEHIDLTAERGLRSVGSTAGDDAR